MNEPTHLDANGRDISAYMNIVVATRYDEVGRIHGVTRQALAYIEEYIAAGERIVLGDGQLGLGGGQSSFWVEVTDGKPELKKRPVLDQVFDRTTLPVDEEAILADVPACTITIEGPWRGTHEHEGGDLHAGFSVPGVYTIAFEAFPAMPVTHTLTVEAQS